MTKTELISAIAENAGISKAEGEKALKGFVDTVTECLKAGDKLNLVGFGVFATSTRAARKGKNPQTGKEIDIAESIAPKFKAGKALKDALNTK